MATMQHQPCFVAETYNAETAEPHLLSKPSSFASSRWRLVGSPTWRTPKSQDHTSTRKDPGERPRELREGVESLSSRFWVFWLNRSRAERSRGGDGARPDTVPATPCRTVGCAQGSN